MLHAGLSLHPLASYLGPTSLHQCMRQVMVLHMTPPLPGWLVAALQASCNDTAAAMQLFDDVAYGNLEQGSIYERSEANLMKVRCCSTSDT